MTMADRNRDILDAAQTLFLERGFAATSIADIRRLSGASVGSIYHAFGGKEAIAAALVERAIADWTAATQRISPGDSFEDLVRSTIEGLIRWAAANPQAFQVMDELRSVSERGQAGERLAALLAEGRAASRAIIEAQIVDGGIRSLPASVMQSLVLGPAYEYLRSCRGDLTVVAPDHLVEYFTEAAWRALAA
jgi:AcrR family transcriptional regulator